MPPPPLEPPETNTYVADSGLLPESHHGPGQQGYAGILFIDDLGISKETDEGAKLDSVKRISLLI